VIVRTRRLANVSSSAVLSDPFVSKPILFDFELAVSNAMSSVRTKRRVRLEVSPAKPTNDTGFRHRSCRARKKCAVSRLKGFSNLRKLTVSKKEMHYTHAEFSMDVRTTKEASMIPGVSYHVLVIDGRRSSIAR
jgi:hypothetical protein